MPHHLLSELTREVLGLTSLGLLLLAPLVLGFVIGSVKAFTRDATGWPGFRLCVTACVSTLAIGVFLVWVVAF